jgi:hypothetical protein
MLAVVVVMVTLVVMMVMVAVMMRVWNPRIRAEDE